MMAGKITRLFCSCSSKFVYSTRNSLLLNPVEKVSLAKCLSTSSSSSSAIIDSHETLFNHNSIGHLNLNRLISQENKLPQASFITSLQHQKVHQNVPFFLNSIQHRIQVPIGSPSINHNNNIINPIIHPTLPFGRIPSHKPTPLEDPLSISNKISIDEAPDVNKVEKHAARLIVIRRIKMNRHKLKKLRKKMKHIWAKVKLRRKIRNERAYLNEKLNMIREAERFDAKEHVAMLIAKAKQKEIPRRWKGKRMPAWWIKQQIALGTITL